MPNRLATQSSPYLLQHAQNPVDWYPWGEEAFAEARRRDVPVLVSIGYSTCYWCHVMERESFENEEIAKQLNAAFVCVKVDREERPDIDDVYMAATVAMLGHGGWPMNVCIDPETRKPFWCGTYFPPEPSRGMPGLAQVVEGISAAWREQRDQVVEQAEHLANAVKEQLTAAAEPVSLDEQPISEAVSTLLRMSDRQHGGFGGAPKFPQPVFLDFLIDVRASLDEDSRKAVDAAVKLTLDKMMLGGIRDHVGGGFHRYAVDNIWLVPHFEKMLYDQAQLAAVYVKAAAVYDDVEYAAVAREVLEYVLREMTDERGLFFSAQDAEVDHREGLNYLWAPAEMMSVLGEEDGLFAVKLYGLDLGANFKDPHHPSEPARNVLYRRERWGGFAPAHVRAINAKLLNARSKRKQPHLDDKVIAAWNGLMISALAQAGAVLGEKKFLDAAAKAADGILNLHRAADGGLLRVSRGGKAATPAFLDDYSCVIQGLLELHHALGGKGKYFAAAEELIEFVTQHFAVEGKLFDTRAEAAELFVRTSSLHDGAMPSGTSVMMHALRQRAALARTPEHIEAMLRVFPAVSGTLRESPVSVINATRCLYRVLVGGYEGAAEKLAAIGPRREEAAVSPGAYPVEVYASADRVELHKDRPATFRVVVRIAPGYHIIAAEPGPGGASLFPLRVTIANGTGVQAFADYPEGKPYGPDGEVFVNTGDVEFDIVLERDGDWSGRPILQAMFQACNETECLKPMTVELDVAIDRAS